MRQEIRRAVLMGRRQSGAMLMAGLAVIFMIIMAVTPAPVQASSQVAEIMLSDQADANGVVAQHRNKFPASVAEIYGTALIAGAGKGKEITTELYYVTRNLKVLSITKDLTGTGEVTFTFAFPKPANGWPPGDYKLVISTSDGATKAVTFQVE
jgi:hypothetical protein